MEKDSYTHSTIARVGNQGEEETLLILNKNKTLVKEFGHIKDIVNLHEAMGVQNLGVDALIINTKDKQFDIDIKTDTYIGKTGNLAIELMYKDDYGKPHQGWFAYSKASHLVWYAIGHHRELYVHSMKDLKEKYRIYRFDHPEQKPIWTKKVEGKSMQIYLMPMDYLSDIISKYDTYKWHGKLEQLRFMRRKNEN